MLKKVCYHAVCLRVKIKVSSNSALYCTPKAQVIGVLQVPLRVWVTAQRLHFGTSIWPVFITGSSRVRMISLELSTSVLLLALLTLKIQELSKFRQCWRTTNALMNFIPFFKYVMLRIRIIYNQHACKSVRKHLFPSWVTKVTKMHFEICLKCCTLLLHIFTTLKVKG